MDRYSPLGYPSVNLRRHAMEFTLEDWQVLVLITALETAMAEKRKQISRLSTVDVTGDINAQAATKAYAEYQLAQQEVVLGKVLGTYVS